MANNKNNPEALPSAVPPYHQGEPNPKTNDNLPTNGNAETENELDTKQL